MAYREGITADRLRQRLDYDPHTGIFIWLERPETDFASLTTWRTWNTRWRGKPAGTTTGPHVGINLDNKIYLAHRLAWLYVYDSWPSGDLDHRDTDKTNNRLDNLRLATQSQNSANTKAHRDNTSGYKGVTWNTPTKRWRAQIMFQYKQIYLGLFDTPEEAHAAYVKAATELFGEFARC